ncbi:uncharacterized protein TNCV_1683211 [Trichonephila clavipes]|nr:uncharacterized protein TNCV_1683211 [Trichonephila clavipes]
MQLHKWSSNCIELLSNFDVSPVVTKAKQVMQELWRLKLDWNDSLPIHLETQWKRFVKSLAAINNLNIPRYILLDDALRIELHGYCDSSLKSLRCCNLCKVSS